MLVTEDVAFTRDTLHQVIGVIARGPDPERALPAIAGLLAEATACHACLIALHEGDVPRVRAASPGHGHHVGRVAAEPDDPALRAIAVPLRAHDGAEAIGAIVLHAEAPHEPGPEALDLLAPVAAVVAGAIGAARRLDGAHREVARLTALVERLAGEHLVRDLFAALAEGRPHAAEARARTAGHDLGRPHVVAVLEPVGGEPDPRWPEVAARAQARLRQAVPGALCDPGDERLRALLPAAGPDALERIDHELDRLAREERLAGGRSEPRSGLAGDQRGLAEATSAARVARAVAPGGGARGYGELGVYRYLAQLPPGHAPDERHAEAIATLAAYDAKRRTELLRTLERHLGDRGALAATARALFIHTNTLRQRLDRIEALTGLELATEDLLSLELALKLARLHGTA